MDTYYLHRSFKEITGFTLLKYQHQVRINQAVSLLLKTELSAAFIGFEIGYSTSSHFSKIFKNTTGISPAAYRNSYKNNINKHISKIYDLPKE